MPFAAGIQRLIDCSQRYYQASSSPVFLRVKNFVDNPTVEDLGFTYTPSGNNGVGTTDYLIDPTPSVILMTMHNLAMAQMANVAVREGARIITISNTWVAARQALMGYDQPERVFNDKSVVGIVCGNFLFQIVSFIHQDAFGGILTWKVTVNTTEISKATIPATPARSSVVMKTQLNLTAKLRGRE